MVTKKLRMPRRPPGRKKGTPKTGGRKKGSPNKATVEVRAAARLLVEDPGYRTSLAVRLKLGEAGPMETLLWQYAYGKPKETVEVTGTDGAPIATEVVVRFVGVEK